MELPLELKAALEQETNHFTTAQLKQSAARLSERYRANTGGGRLLSEPSEAAAYAAVRMPATFAAVYSALCAVCRRVELPVSSLLDVGAGTGAAAWAASACFALNTVACVEREEAMLSLGKKLMQAGCAPLKQAQWLRGSLPGALPEARADLVTAAYVLNELPKSARQQALCELWERAGKLLLLVEPGTPAGFRNLLSARELLLSRGAYLAAPCPHASRCPLPGEDWCHFTCRVARSRLHKLLKDGDAPYEDEKYAYLALAKAPCAPAPARILRHPQIESGKITLTLCTPQGLRQALYTKKDGDAFKAARKSAAGDEMPHLGRVIK